MIRRGKLYRRRELKKGSAAPVDFEEVYFDTETGKTIGWVPIGYGPEDKWHREAFTITIADGTYELVGPHIQGNPEGYEQERLIPHSALALPSDMQPPRDFNGLREWLSDKNIEGIVFHHTDGRMAKIKKRDFGLKR